MATVKYFNDPNKYSIPSTQVTVDFNVITFCRISLTLYIVHSENRRRIKVEFKFQKLLGTLAGGRYNLGRANERAGDTRGEESMNNLFR